MSGFKNINIIPAKRIEATYFSYWFENGIFYGKFNKGLQIDIEVAKAIVSKRKEITNYQTVFYLADITDILSIDTAAREYMSSPEAYELLSGGAICARNPLFRIVGSAFILLVPPPVPTRIFADAEKAYLWLKKLQAERR